MIPFLIALSSLIALGIIAVFLFVVRIINDLESLTKQRLKYKNGKIMCNPL